MSRPQTLHLHAPDVCAVSEALRAAVVQAERVLLTGPTAPDGDSIGACLALAKALRALGSATVHVAGEVSYRYAWLPGTNTMVSDDDIAADYDVVIVMDGDARRLVPTVSTAFDAAATKVIIDHHRSTRADGYDIALIDHTAASTCDLVHLLMGAWGLPLDAETATLIYAGIVYDTGGFRHSNTRPETLRLAAELIEFDIDHPSIMTRILMERRPAGLRLLGRVVTEAEFHAGGQVLVGRASYELGTGLGAGPGDIDGIVDHLVYAEGVELACFFIEREPERIKLSLRSRSFVDVAALARTLSPEGGGHARAAGAQLDGTLDDVLARVLPVLEAAVTSAAGE